jgi:sugar lactone lactonase YvrE
VLFLIMKPYCVADTIYGKRRCRHLAGRSYVMRDSGRGRWALAGVLMLFVTVLAVTGCRPIRPLRSASHRAITPRDQVVSQPKAEAEATLIEVASSNRLWTGVAVSKQGRIFVTYPRWSADIPFSVGEISESGQIVPFPNKVWNAWDASSAPADHFICVQSVYVDSDDFLWVLDPASAYMGGVIPGGAKLLKVDLAANKVVKKILLDQTIAPSASYLNDIRVDTERQVAYITDSGLGALIIVDLKSGTGRRLLTGHHSTRSEDVVLTIGGSPWRINGRAPQVHADGLALDMRGEYLYYQALTGRNLYRIETRYLRDPTVSERQLAMKVETLGETGAADGIVFGPDGYLYLTAIEDNAINMFTSPGMVKTIVKDPRLLWPDSLARGPNGYLYVTTSQIHLGSDIAGPYRMFKLIPLR